MSTVVTPPPAAQRVAVPPPLPAHDLFDRLRRFTRAEYQALLKAGILSQGEPVELLEGLVVCKMSKGTLHVACVRRLAVRLPRFLPDGWLVQTQEPAGLPDGEPEPDGAILRGELTDYDDHFPEPHEIGVVIEVADSSLITDRRDKGRQYARAGIPVYWLLNVIDRHVEVYSNPDAATDPPYYVSLVVYSPGQDLPIVLDGATAAHIPAADLLP